MKGDDGTVAGIFFHVFEHVIGCCPFGVVARDDIPHDDLKFSAKPPVFAFSHPSVRRPEEFRVDELLCFVGVEDICYGPVVDGVEMVVGVVPDLMSLVHDLLKEFGMALDVFAHHEECGLDIVFAQYFQDDGCGFWDGAVVESEIDGFFSSIHSPDGFGIHPSEPYCGLFYEHVVAAWKRAMP